MRKRRAIAADDLDRFPIASRKSVDRGGAVKRTGAFRWPRPKSPFDARVIGAEHPRSPQTSTARIAKIARSKVLRARAAKTQRETRKRNARHNRECAP